ncbi:TrbC/VirB2 family protein [Neisseria sp. Ec49-e6-T10]|uniref:TrbC/VirB2 family protein n=1 Tax=Neisseria sp. Ec49-e6-T10 TaxID=3140744 RepID=UPI003EC04209
MKALQKSQISQWLLAAFLSVLCPLTMAAGFEGEVTSMITMIRNGIYVVVGVVATICLLWQFAQGFMGRKTWGDILETGLWIVGAGAGIVIATWLFAKGGSMTF